MTDQQQRRSKRFARIGNVRHGTTEEEEKGGTETMIKRKNQQQQLKSVVVSPETNPPSKRRKGSSSRSMNHVDERRPDQPSSSSSTTLDNTIYTIGESKMGLPILPETILSNPLPSSSLPSSLSLNRPTLEECEYVVTELGKLHPQVMIKNEEIRSYNNPSKGMASSTSITQKHDAASSCGFQSTVLDGVIATILSQNTTAANSNRAYNNLRKAFDGGNWNLLCQLPTPDTIESAIHCAGLAKKRAQCIWDLCHTVVRERGGDVSLEYLRTQSSADVQKELIRFRGLGKKTISCVLLFTLGRSDFPVDTHVHRISILNKWIPTKYSRDDAYEYLNAIIPAHLKLDLHCLLVQHGRECHRCAARGKPQFPPKDGSKLHCPLAALNKVGTIQGNQRCDDLLRGKLAPIACASNDLVKI
jgi:endonuclease-3